MMKGMPPVTTQQQQQHQLLQFQWTQERQTFLSIYENFSFQVSRAFCIDSYIHHVWIL